MSIICCDQGAMIDGQGWDRNTSANDANHHNNNNVVWEDVVNFDYGYVLLGSSSANSPVEVSQTHFSSPDEDARNLLLISPPAVTVPPPTPPLPPSPCSSPNLADQDYYQITDLTRCKRVKYSPVNNNKGGEEIESREESTTSLGLKLNKTPSLIDLVEKRLFKGKDPSRSRSNSNSPDRNLNNNNKPNSKSSVDYRSLPMSEKLKASNFPALYLKIGNWERFSQNEGDLVAKCYYAKKKLVWEILEGALKSKIEIQWNDIIGIRAIMLEDEPGTLEIELGKPPSFFRETNPQPRKHTLWEQTKDFTGGEAPNYRIHYVKFPPGALDKHYEKLLQCHPTLSSISLKPFPTERYPYFGTYDSQSDFVLHGYGSQSHQFRTSNTWMPPTRTDLPNLQLAGMNQYSPSVTFNNMMVAENGRTPVIFPNHVLPCERLRRPVPTANIGQLGYIENHLLRDNQIISSGEIIITHDHMSSMQHPLALHDQIQMANMTAAGGMMQQEIVAPDGGGDHSLMEGQQAFGDAGQNVVPLMDWEIGEDLRMPQARIMSSPYDQYH